VPPLDVLVLPPLDEEVLLLVEELVEDELLVEEEPDEPEEPDDPLDVLL
jgi:hypothetical protein